MILFLYLQFSGEIQIQLRFIHILGRLMVRDHPLLGMHHEALGRAHLELPWRRHARVVVLQRRH